MQKLIIFLILLVSQLSAQVKFDEHFLPKTLRVDYAHSGNKSEDFYFFKALKEEPYWGGSKVNLIDKFEYGKYLLEVFESASQKLIYSRTFSTLFSEWQTTKEAEKINKSFDESVVMPFPKNKVQIVISSRNRDHSLTPKFRLDIDPKNYFIDRGLKTIYDTIVILNSGDYSKKVDIVIIPDGYTSGQMIKFEKDARRFADYIFNSSPYKENKNNFNVRAVKAPSLERGTDIPAEGQYPNTLLNTTFYTFDEERYLMTEDFNKVRDIAANVPYDQIYILVNSNKYGGGAIYNHYSVCTSDDRYGEYVFVHELGHGFAFLADEYFTSSTAYIDFYPLNIEPLEPNITTLVDFESKWKHLVTEGTPIPTPTESKYKNVTGAFEGGGYVAKGVYRPKMDCSMNSISVDNYCPVCSEAIVKMIQFYSE
ncbi:MAG: peptidase M64 [Ignavibacteriaceae bacterium]|nr:peptidase M64 [Ignavibacteriaceae bacterium]